MPRILQALMSFLGFQREQICEPETNLFSWKRSKNSFKTDILNQMKNYQPLGPNSATLRHTQTLNFVEKLLHGYTQEDVDNYHVGFGRLFKWLTLAIHVRKHDITRRHALQKRAKEDRENKILQNEQIEIKKEEYLVDVQAQFKADNQDVIDAHDRWT